MAREVAASAEVEARKEASNLVRKHGRRKAEQVAWEYSDRAKEQQDKARYEIWQAIIRNIVDRSESPAIDDERRVPIDHGAAQLPKIVTDERVPVGTAEIRDSRSGKLLGKIVDIGDGS